MAMPLAPLVKDVVSAHSKALAKASAQAQQALSGELDSQLAVLQHRKPRTLAELGNTSKREGRASVAAKLVAASAKLYGWDFQSQQPQTLNLTQVNVSHASDIAPGTKIIDVPPDE